MICKINEDFVSIIIPVYNGEKTIDKCLDSILEQSYKNVEIIIINDGSTDNTIEALQGYLNQYENIYLFDIKNTGVSNARNLGIQKSHGKYICFIDCDDELKLNFLEKMVQSISEAEADIAVCGFSLHYDIQPEKIFLPIDESNQDTAVIKTNNYSYLFCLYKKRLLNPVWNKLYKKESLSGVSFDVSLAAGEDLLFNIKAIENSNQIVLVKENFYKYYYNSVAGIRTQIARCTFSSYIRHQAELIKLFENATEEILIDIANSCVRELMGCYFATLARNNFRFIPTLQYYDSIGKDEFIIKLRSIVLQNNANGIQGNLFVKNWNILLLIFQYLKFIYKKLKRGI